MTADIGRTIILAVFSVCDGMVELTTFRNSLLLVFELHFVDFECPDFSKDGTDVFH